MIAERSAVPLLRRTRSLLLTSSLVVGALMAAPATATATPALVPVDTWTELQNAVGAGHGATLEGHVLAEPGERLTIPAGAAVVLDLAGWTLDVTRVVTTGQAAVSVPATATLRVTSSAPDGRGTLSARGGAGAAGIGGDDAAAVGSIVIEAGVITAYGGLGGSGIGSGSNGSGGTLTIDGGTVTARGGTNGAGIGGGSSASGGVVTVAGGEVTAVSAGYGAGIGGGATGAGGTISITGGVVVATGSRGGAGIGGGRWGGAGGTVTVTGGTVTANGSAYGAGIGGGASSCDGIPGCSQPGGDGGALDVRGGSVTAAGAADGVAVGGGDRGAGAAVTVSTAGALTVTGPRAFGAGTGGSGSWGSWSSSGRVTIGADTTWTVPAGTTSVNSGVLILDGAIDGLGTIDNTGSIRGSGRIANDGQGLPGTTVSTHSRVLSFASQAGEPVDPMPIHARTAQEAQTSLPEPVLPDGYTFTGWYTAAEGGSQVTDTTDLLEVLGAGPRRSTLHGRHTIAQSVVFTSSPPASAAVYDTYTPTTTRGGSTRPVVLSVGAATTGDACAITDGVVSFDHPGTCVLAADQASDVLHTAAPTATQTITVGPAAQAITLVDPPTTATVGERHDLTATSSGRSGAPIVLSVAGATTDDACSITAGVVSFHHAGTCVLAADQAGDTRHAAARRVTHELTVRPVATTTTLTVTGDRLSATVAPAAAGAGTPTGTVAFTVAGHRVGTAHLDGDGIASLPLLPTGVAGAVAADYAGSTRHGASSASRMRVNPGTTASVAAAAPRRHGWYRGPVIVSFVCTAATAPLISCPAAVTLRDDGAGQQVSRTALAADGGTTTVVVGGINLDRSGPVLRILGARAGQLYARAPEVRCVARDELSGIAGTASRACRVTTKTTMAKRTKRIEYTATASDRVGNQTVRTLAVRVRIRR